MPSELNWYVSATAKGDTLTPVPLDDNTDIGVYRRGDDSYDILLSAGGETFDPGIRDRSVSRMREDGAPVRFRRDGNGVEIRNVDNVGPITVDAPGKSIELEKGDRRTVSNECAVTVGYNTKLLLTSEFEQTDTGEEEATINHGGGEIPVSAYVQVLCRHFRQTSRESVGDARSCARNLRDVMNDHPLKFAGYEEVRQRLERQIEQLEVKDSHDTLDSDRITRHGELADEIEQLYSRV